MSYLLNKFVCLICSAFIRTEGGTYYELHLGGTNFRVSRVHLSGQPSSVLEHEVERQFKLGRKIGSGSFGELYLGMHFI